MSASKQCSRCGEARPLDDFHRNEAAADGLSSRCAPCRRTNPLDRPPPAGTTNTDWMADANCRGVNPDLFFPARGGMDDLSKARETCRGCIVREDCLQYALANGEKWGIWGGLSERERRKLRRRKTLVA